MGKKQYDTIHTRPAPEVLQMSNGLVFALSILVAEDSLVDLELFAEVIVISCFSTCHVALHNLLYSLLLHRIRHVVEQILVWDRVQYLQYRRHS